jgi:protease I
MNSMSLAGARVAFLLTNGFEDRELDGPWKVVLEHGGKPTLISPQSGVITGKRGEPVRVDLPVDLAAARLFDALILPGGHINSGHLRENEYAVGFVRDFMEANKPVGTICHGGWILIDAKKVRGRTLTSHPSLKEAFTAAGAHWVDREVVVDGNLFSSRNPDDLPAFQAALVREVQIYAALG